MGGGMSIASSQLKRRCNICLQSHKYDKTTKYNDHVTVCFTCQKIITQINKENWIAVPNAPPL